MHDQASGILGKDVPEVRTHLFHPEVMDAETLALLLPVPVTLSLLFVVYVIFQRMGKMRESSPPKPHVLREPSKSVFVHRPSRFDTMGNLLTSWKPLDATAIVSDQEWMGTRNSSVLALVRSASCWLAAQPVCQSLQCCRTAPQLSWLCCALLAPFYSYRCPTQCKHARQPSPYDS